MSARRSVHDAARAMESSGVGLLVVQDLGAIVGVITDRDIAIRVVGYGLDPLQTILGEIMTAEVATLPISASVEEAISLMQSRGIRRIPLLEYDRLVGIVSVDDLIVDGALPLAEAGRILRAQFAHVNASRRQSRVLSVEVGRNHDRPAKSDGSKQLLGTLIHRVQTMTGIESREAAMTALEVVLGGIVRRITSFEASDLLKQLPAGLRARLNDVVPGSKADVGRMSIERELAQRLGLRNEQAARLMIDVEAVLDQAALAGKRGEVRREDLPRGPRGLGAPRSTDGSA